MSHHTAVAPTPTGAATLIERHTIREVPPSERHGRMGDLFTTWFATNIQLLPVVTGALAVQVFGLSFVASVLAIVVGTLAGAVFMALHSAQGPRLGVPQMIQTRAQFGSLGSVLVVAVVIVMYVGWFASGLVVGGEVINEISAPVGLGTGIVITGLIGLAICAMGHDVIHRIGRIVTVLGGLAFVAGVVATVAAGLPAGLLSLGAVGWGPFLGMSSVAALWTLAYAPYTSDYSRYLPVEAATTARTFWVTLAGVGLGSILTMVWGALLARLVVGDGSVIGVINDVAGGYGWLLLLLFALGNAYGSAVNLYCSTLCTMTLGQNLAPRWRPGGPTRAAVGALTVALSLYFALGAAADFVASYVNFVFLLLYLLVPWTAINLVDYYLIRRGSYDVDAFFDPSGGRYGRVNWMAVGCYVVGIAVQVPFMGAALHTGVLVDDLGGADLAWVVGLVVTGPVYYLFARSATRPVRVR